MAEKVKEIEKEGGRGRKRGRGRETPKVKKRLPEFSSNFFPKLTKIFVI